MCFTVGARLVSQNSNDNGSGSVAAASVFAESNINDVRNSTAPKQSKIESINQGLEQLILFLFLQM